MVKIVDSIEKANAVTHCGTMHADEIFATAFLDLYLGDRSVYRINNVDVEKKQLFRILVTPSGIVIVVIFVFKNASLPISFNDDGNVIFVNCEQ